MSVSAQQNPEGMMATHSPSSPVSSSFEVTQRERMLLDRIEKLEKRLGELETRTTAQPTGNREKTGEAVSAVPSSSTGTVQEKVAKPEKKVPFAFGDFTWMNGQSRQKTQPLSNEFGTFSLYLDTNYNFSFNKPSDNTIGGSATVGRHNEFGVNLASVGFELNHPNIIANISLQTGSGLNIIQDLDGSVAHGKNLTTGNLRNIREAYAGYHFDKMYGVNVEAGIFMSYIGLESYLTAENWNYNRSLVCDFTPFYFTGVRAQFFPTEKIKIEPWLINGWQTYGKWNNGFGAGLSNYYRPKESLAFVANFYYGTDTRGNADRIRFHHDDSILARYYNRPESSRISKMAFSMNNHYGFESGGGGLPRGRAYMAGTSIANRIWFNHDKYALTIRGEAITNPSRYLSPPVSAIGFLPTGDTTSLKIYGITTTFDYMPTDFMTFRMEFMHRGSNVPYFSGQRGTTSIDGFQGTPGDFVPDLRKRQNQMTFAVNFRY